MGRGEFAIIGTGEVPCGNYPERSEFEIAYRVAKQAIEDSGIDKNEIGAVLAAGHIMSNPQCDFNTEMYFGRLPEAIGAKGCKVAASTISGGASSYSVMKTAEGILHSGETDTVLVVHAQRFSQFTPNEQAKFFAIAGSDVEWEVPYGMTYNALAAMVTQAYMNETGTTIALMCNVLADGGSAFVVTTAEKARKVCEKPVYFLGEASDYSHRLITRAKERDFGKWGEGFTPVFEKAYELAGVGPEDMDIYQIYGSYPCIALMVMDAMGIVKPGMSGELFERGDTWPGAKYPTSTNGEALSFGHTGTGCGFALLVETVRQLQGKAGAAQVPGARFAVKDCGGGAFMDIHATVLGNEIPG
jgi:acetyl-CoA C-acetyltransferase